MSQVTTQPSRIVVAGVEVDARYADGKDPLIPAGALTMVTVLLTGEHRRKATTVMQSSALVGMAQIDPATGEVTEWQAGLPGCGWVAGVTWPTVEAAVKAVRDPAIVARLQKFDALTHQAYDAERHARELRQQADDARGKLLAEIGDVR